MKHRSILYFLAVGVFCAAPALADRIPEASSEREGKSVSIAGPLTDHSFQLEAKGHKLDPDVLKQTGPFSHMREFDEDGMRSVMNGQSSADSNRGDVDFLPLGHTDGKDFGKQHPEDVDQDGSSLSVVVATEPESFTLVLLGVGVLGMLFYRRSSL